MELIQEAARIYNSYNCEEGDYFISQINSKVMSE